MFPDPAGDYADVNRSNPRRQPVRRAVAAGDLRAVNRRRRGAAQTSRRRMSWHRSRTSFVCRRRLLQQRLLGQPVRVRRGHGDPRRQERPPARPDRLELPGDRGTESSRPIKLTIEHAYLLRAAAEGVSMLSPGRRLRVESPSSDPYATAVGGPPGIGPAMTAALRDRLVHGNLQRCRQ